MERKKNLKANDNELITGFKKLQTRSDVADLLEISDKKLRYWLFKVNDSAKYVNFTIAKKNGGVREISAPYGSYKLLQRNLAHILYLVHKSKFCSYGFEKNITAEDNTKIYKNIITNAENHVNKKYVLNIDIKDFFTSINFGRVRGLFKAPPFSLSDDVSTILAQICCYNGRLPQGAPTSPVISNMICRRLDNNLLPVAKENKCTYSRYADDITLSTNLKEFPEALFKNNGLSDELALIIKNNGFEINNQKVRLMTRKDKQEVSGIKVNKKLNIERNYIKNIRAMLYNWENLSLDGAIERFQSIEPNNINKNFKKVLFGRIDFIKQVRGEDDSIYIKLWNKYQILNASPHKVKPLIQKENKHIQDLIAGGENYKVEFKESFEYCASRKTCEKSLHYKDPQNGKFVDSPKFKVLRAINSFLNSEEGGTVIVGVLDDRKRIGIEADLKNCSKGVDSLECKIMDWIKDYMTPIPFNKIKLSFHVTGKYTICEISVKPCSEPICLNDKTYNKHSIFVRHGNTSRELGSLDIKEWMREHDKFAFKCPNC